MEIATAHLIYDIRIEREFAMANGWAPDGAVQDQIDDSITEAILEARARMPSGESLEACEECGDDIPERRRVALPGVRTCIACQGARDACRIFLGGINRRGSKDSQLR
jgi:phage/conjugal plasmid C-4 type zinc finger TraR family protein